jgi:hypothetical protein
MQSTLITRVLFVCGNRSGRDVACMFDEKMQVMKYFFRGDIWLNILLTRRLTLYWAW